ncbi:MAG TPA: hypothetical protein VHO70_17755, partial [Chitinispirillaceae bacterium]|nr:hypothetical protein [Chitinispirillaceae bacterium]
MNRVGQLIVTTVKKTVSIELNCTLISFGMQCSLPNGMCGRCLRWGQSKVDYIRSDTREETDEAKLCTIGRCIDYYTA